MQGVLIRKTDVYYRCLARTLTPGSEALAEHPRTVNLPEGDVVAALNTWIGELFGRENVDRTVAALLASQAGERKATDHEVLKKRAADAGVDPVALVDGSNEAQARRAAATAELEGAPARTAVTDAEILKEDLEKLNQLHGALGVGLLHEPKGRTVMATVSPRVVSACVRGAWCGGLHRVL